MAFALRMLRSPRTAARAILPSHPGFATSFPPTHRGTETARSCPAPTATATGGVVSESIRTMVVYNEQHAALFHNAAMKKYRSNVWVQADDEWAKKETTLKDDQVPTEAQIEKTLMYYNADQLEGGPATVMGLPSFVAADTTNSSGGGDASSAPSAASNPLHRGAFRGKVFSTSWQKSFSEHAQQRGYTSNLWLTTNDLRSHKDTLHLSVAGRREPPLPMSFKVSARFYNAEQFQQPDIIHHKSISGKSRTPFPPQRDEVLKKVASERHWGSGLYFTERHIKQLGLRLKEGATGVPCPKDELPWVAKPGLASEHPAAGARRTKMFNVDQLEGYEAVLTSLNRLPTTVPSFLLSCKPLTAKMLESTMASSRTTTEPGRAPSNAVNATVAPPAAIDAPSNNGVPIAADKVAPPTAPQHATNYWVTQADAERMKWKLRDGAQGVAIFARPRTRDDGHEVTSLSALDMLLYNVEELEVPAKGFELAGKVTQDTD